MIDEIRDVPGFPGYGVSSSGGVFSSLRGPWRRCSTALTHCGYERVRVVRPARRLVYVHRMVAAAWIGPLPDGLQVNHIDGRKWNNCWKNLEYVTGVENMRHARDLGLIPVRETSPRQVAPPRPRLRGEAMLNAKLSDAQVDALRRCAAAGQSMASLGRTFGVSKQHAHRIVRGLKRRLPTPPPYEGPHGQNPPRVTATPGCR